MATLHTTTMPAFLAARQERETGHLLLEALPAIQRCAAHLACVYGWASPHIEAEDLVQVGCLAGLEVLEQGRQFTGNPVAYLVAVARNAMRRYCGTRASLIIRPRTHTGYAPALPVLSLDAPLSPAAECTLLDVLQEDGTSA